MPDERAAVVFDDALPRLGPRHFVTARDVMSLTGRTSANAQIVIRSADGAARASAYADAEGRFGVNVPMRAASEAFDLQVIAPSGFASEDRFDDHGRPDAAADRVRDAAARRHRGRMAAAAGAGSTAASSSWSTGGPSQLIDEAFDQTMTLQQGANEIELVASDLVGNVSVEKLEIFLDQEPPELVRQSLSPNAGERRRRGDRGGRRARCLGHEAGGAVQPCRSATSRSPTSCGSIEPARAIARRSFCRRIRAARLS